MRREAEHQVILMLRKLGALPSLLHTSLLYAA